jgi:hypothetical protein
MKKKYYSEHLPQVVLDTLTFGLKILGAILLLIFIFTIYVISKTELVSVQSILCILGFAITSGIMLIYISLQAILAAVYETSVSD